jgi:hypothetical protein
MPEYSALGNVAPATNDLNVASTERPAWRFSLRALFYAFTGLALLLSVTVLIFRVARDARDRIVIEVAMDSVALGLWNYESTRDQLPPPTTVSPSGQALGSWRFAIVPYITQRPINGSIPWDPNQPWNAPVHRPLAKWMAEWYCWDGLIRPKRNSPSKLTGVFAITGAGTAFDAAENTRLIDCGKNVILLMEVADSKTHWMQPGDYDVTKLLAATGHLGDHVNSILPHRIHVLFADGEVWTLSDETPMAAFKPFLTIAQAKTHDRDKLLGPYRVD